MSTLFEYGSSVVVSQAITSGAILHKCKYFTIYCRKTSEFKKACKADNGYIT